MKKYLKIALLVLAPICLLGQTFSVGKYAITGGTAQRSDANRWTDRGANVLEFGADPTGAADSTIAIQSAIDSLNGTTQRDVFCPDGTYKISAPIFLDPPGNLRGADGVHGQTWLSGGGYSKGETVNSSGIAYINLTGTNTATAPAGDTTNWRVFAWSSGTTYAVNAVVSYNANNPADTLHATPWVSLQSSNLNNAPVANSAFWAPFFVYIAGGASYNFGYSFNGNYGLPGNQGCNLNISFDNGVFFWIGPGNGMLLQGVNLQGSNPNSRYRGQYPASGAGVCVSSGSGGANRTRIENTGVGQINQPFMTGCNAILNSNLNGTVIASQAALGAETSWRRVFAANCFQFLTIGASQNDVSNVYESSDQCTQHYRTMNGPGIHVSDSNPSNPFGANNTFAISAPTGTGFSGGIGNFQYFFNTTITFPVPSDICGASPGCLSCPASAANTGNCVYGGWTMALPHYGIVPLIMLGYNSSTHAATFVTTVAWGVNMFGGTTNATLTTDILTEIGAVTTLYASEIGQTFVGQGIQATHLHIEQGICTTFFTDGNGGFKSEIANIFDHIRFNYDIGMPGGGVLPYQYCQAAWPFIDAASLGGPSNFEFRNPTIGQASRTVNIDLGTGSSQIRCAFKGVDRGGASPWVMQNPSLRIQGGWGYNHQGLGCEWDSTPFYPSSNAEFIQDTLGMPQMGWGPSPYSRPRIVNQWLTLWQNVGTTNINTYPQPFGTWLYDVADNNPNPLVPTKIVQSLHGFYSYGQVLNAASVGGSGVSWALKGGSCVVLIDNTTAAAMFPGLGILLTTNAGPYHYVVSGVYPGISLDGGTHGAYMTIRDQIISNAQCNATGVSGTVYTGTSIGQDPYVLSVSYWQPLGTPTLTSCGTSPSLTSGSSNTFGSFTTGTATPTACTVNFTPAYATNAECTISPANVAANGITGGTYISAQSTSAFTITLGAGTNAAKYNYVCSGN